MNFWIWVAIAVVVGLGGLFYIGNKYGGDEDLASTDNADKPYDANRMEEYSDIRHVADDEPTADDSSSDDGGGDDSGD